MQINIHYDRTRKAPEEKEKKQAGVIFLHLMIIVSIFVLKDFITGTSNNIQYCCIFMQ